ncbi:hypothetical protein HanRHA438_Chr03g0110301 [Helianthus annuus]|nr:hypothetical protein HanRHA438_Chr03g0110301 [Helianthus annuus]
MSEFFNGSIQIMFLIKRITKYRTAITVRRAQNNQLNNRNWLITARGGSD